MKKDIVKVFRGKIGNAGAAAALVIIIALLIVLYVLFLPPSERAALLGEGRGGQVQSPGQQYPYPGQQPQFNSVLFEEDLSGYRLYEDNSIEVKIPSFSLKKIANAREFAKEESLLVETSLFDKNIETMRFFLGDEVVEEAFLSFNVEGKTDGRLIIRLNGKEIFRDFVKEGSMPPLLLNSQLLEKENVIEFEMEAPDWKFWKLNSLLLKKVVVSGTAYKEMSGAAKERFSISQEDYDLADKFEFVYVANCQEDARKSNYVLISLNSKTLFSGEADCFSLNKIPISKELLNVGDNVLDFSSLEGSFFIDQIKIRAKVKEDLLPAFSFSVPGDMYDFARGNRLKIYYEVNFLSPGNKAGFVYVNDNKIPFNVNSQVVSGEITSFVNKGSNIIRIVPKSDMSIGTVRVYFR